MILPLLFSATISLAGGLECSQLFPDSLGKKLSPSVPIKPGFLAEEAISYGLEIEYDVKTNPKILADYIPAKMDLSKWIQMSLPERAKYVQQSLGKSKLEKSVKHLLGTFVLFRMPDAPTWLPEQVTVETHGTVEISGVITNTYQGLDDISFKLESRLGKGFYQSHVVFVPNKASGLAGFALFDADRSEVQVLSQGYEKHLERPDFAPGANLLHYALGPLSEKSLASILKAGQSALNGDSVGSGGSQRLIYGAALRDDVYPEGKVGYELRQYSSNRAALMKGTWELTEILAENRTADFQQYESVKMIEWDLAGQMVSDPKRITLARVQQYLHSIENYLKQQSSFVVTGGARFDERFLFPLRDWEQNPVVAKSLNSIEAKAQIHAATQEYIAEFQEIILGNVAPADGIRTLQIAMGKWAFNSGLAPLFDLYAKSDLNVDAIPWNAQKPIVRGPFVGVPLKADTESLRLWTTLQKAKLGIADSADTISFYNLIHDNSKFATIIKPSDIVDAALITQRWDSRGKKLAHVMIKIDFKKTSVNMYEQTPTGLGRHLTTDSIILTVSFQNSQAENGQEIRSGFRDNSRAISFRAFNGADSDFTRTATTEAMALTPEQVSDLLKDYIEMAEARGGNEAFNLDRNNCATNCYQLVSEAVHNRSIPRQIVETLLRVVDFDAKWTSKLFHLNGWIR